MNHVQKPSNSECHTPPSGPFRHFKVSIHGAANWTSVAVCVEQCCVLLTLTGRTDLNAGRLKLSNVKERDWTEMNTHKISTLYSRSGGNRKRSVLFEPPIFQALPNTEDRRIG